MSWDHQSPTRRPSGTPALGVPDVEWANARATAANSLIGNKKWVSLVGQSVTAINPIYQIAATISMTALSTGRFRARLVGYVGNSAAGGHNIFPGMSHGTGVLVPDYAQTGGLLVSPSGEGSGSTIALIVDFPANGFTAVVGTTTAINALTSVDSGTTVFMRNNAVQFEVEEY